MTVKVLIANTYDAQGGAARAAYRLHRCLQDIGIESQMLVQVKSCDDDTVQGPKSNYSKLIGRIRPRIDGLPLMRYPNKSKILFSPAWFRNEEMIHKIQQSDADVVHLHWISRGMFRIEDLVRINKPLVWSLHDNWGFTGGCHVMWDCENYKNACNSCPVLGSSNLDDLSSRVFNRKVKAYAKLDLTIVGLSRWMADCAANSRLFNAKRIVNLPNPIDSECFKPLDKNAARDMLGLPPEKKLLFFGAVDATGDINKGFTKLSEALGLLKSRNIELVVFGSNKPKHPPDFGFRSHYLGKLNDDIFLRALYSAGDVVVVPSLQENLSNVIMESISCGTPVVGFDVGGNGDLIDHRLNGYLATPFNTEDLARGI